MMNSSPPKRQHRSSAPAGFPQAAGEELENPVSVGVPEVVIHVFKVVEIGKGEAERRMGILIGFLCAAEFAHGQFEECTPV